VDKSKGLEWGHVQLAEEYPETELLNEHTPNNERDADPSSWKFGPQVCAQLWGPEGFKGAVGPAGGLPHYSGTWPATQPNTPGRSWSSSWWPSQLLGEQGLWPLGQWLLVQTLPRQWRSNSLVCPCSPKS
jgi:hypothetical protein